MEESTKSKNDILVVDDSPNNLLLLFTRLSEEGYMVRTAKNGPTALSVIDSKVPDLILLDIMMPEMTGFEVMERLKQKDHLKDVPIILISAKNETRDITKGFKLGAVDYITKPFEFDEVLSRIKTHLAIYNANIKLEKSNKDLQAARIELQQLNAQLEDLVYQRTCELETANEALRKSEEKYREFIEDTEDLITQVDRDGNFLYVNHASKKFFGLTPEECIGRSAFLFVHKDDQERTKNWLDECLNNKIQSSSIENKQVSKTGEIFDIVWKVRFHYDETGKLSYINSIAHDITELIIRRKAEKALRHSENKFKTYVDYAPVGIFVLDELCTILEVNSKACEMIGCPANEIIGKHLHKWIYSKDKYVILSIHNDSFNKHGKASDEIRFIINDIIRNWLVRSVQLSGNKHLIFAIDITNHKQYELQLNQYEKMEAVGQLASGMAHDFNNQLTGILGYAQLLKHELEPVNPNLASFAQSIATGLLQSSDLSRQLLNISRKEDLLTIPADLHGIISEVINLLYHSIPKNIEIISSLNANISTVLGDPGLFQSLFLNLGLNARDAMPDGGNLIFASKNIELDENYFTDPAKIMIPGPYLSIDVIDTGIGMDEKTLKHIFEPFFTTKQKGKGTGMGLAVVYSTIKNFKGFIRVESLPNQGTTFHIYFPIIGGDSYIKDKNMKLEKPVSGHGHILFIDDEAIICQVIPTLLENLGYTVSVCKNGYEGVDFYKKNWQNIDLVILDIMMPLMDGKDTFTLIRKISPDIPVLISTGLANNEDIQEMFDNGAKGLIAKPFNEAQISNIIHEVLSHR